MDSNPKPAQPVLLTLPEAIARQEGFGRPGARATRNNNPGNLNFGTVARMWGSLRADTEGYAIFPHEKNGWSALKYLLTTPAYRGHVLHEVVSRYAPASKESLQALRDLTRNEEDVKILDLLIEHAPATGDPRGGNDLLSYLRNLCHWTGMQPNSCIDGFINASKA